MSDNKNRLEEVAIDIVQRHGTAGISFRKLAGEIGIKSSSVHYHYPEKTDLIQTIIASYSEQFFVHLKKIENLQANLPTKISAFIDLFDQTANEDKFCLCGMMAAELETLDQKSVMLLKKFFTEVEAWLTTLLDTHQTELTRLQDNRASAKNIISSLEGALLIDRVYGNTERMTSHRKSILALIDGSPSSN